MKKILLPILTLGGLLFAASCQMDEPDAGTLTGEVDFSITAGIPNGITTYADGAEAFSHQGGASNLSTNDYILRYTLQVYDEDNKLSYEGVQYATDFGGVTFEARLLAKVYDFVFWADFVSASDQESDLYYNTDDLRNISYTSSVTDDNIPSDALDAYYKTEVVDLRQSGQKINNVTLKRPFGKIRFVATDELSEQQKGAVDNGNVSVAYKEVTVLPNVFDAQTGKATVDQAKQARISDFTATPVAEKASVNGKVHENAYLLGYDYIFCSESQPSYAMDVTVSIDGVSPVTRSLSSIPVQENKLTTIIGNFYTNEGSIDVVVEDSFDEPEIEMTEMEMLKNIALNGGEITLNDDCIFSEEPFIVDPGEGKSVEINLNGHTIESINSQNDAIWVKSGTLIFNGDGNVGGENGCYAVWATEDSKVILNGGNYYGNGACIQAKDNAQVKINGGYYKVGQPYNGVYFVINLQDNQSNTIVVTGGQFENCDPSNTGTEPANVSDNFLADGYSSVKISDNPDVYEVVGADLPVINDNAKTVQISSASAMSAFAVMVNNGEAFENYTVTLKADIDLNYQPWTPIGTSTNAFKGNFDGNGYKISNLKAGTDSQSDVGLFGFTTNGTIKNIHIHNAQIKGYMHVGVVAGTPYTTKYSNIKVTGLIKVDGYAYVGGMFGKNVYANLTDLTIDADEGSYVKAESENYRTYVGGVVGFMGEGGHSVSNVVSNIDVYGSTCDVGGITGIAHYNNKFINCICTGNVTLENAQDSGDQLEIGGIAGVWHNEDGTTVTFTDCSFSGTLTTSLNGVDCSDEIADTNKITGRAYETTGTGQLIIDGVVVSGGTQ